MAEPVIKTSSSYGGGEDGSGGGGKGSGYERIGGCSSSGQYANSSESKRSMECNRDEALRAKEIAEKKFLSNDYLGARKFALKAQSLYADLDNIKQMIAAFNVHIAAEDRIGGDSNWYKVLEVTPDADAELVIKQYRKMVLLIHPDKNKSAAADGASKLINAAKSVLCDKDLRSTFDKKWNIAAANDPKEASGKSSSKKSTPRNASEKDGTSTSTAAGKSSDKNGTSTSTAAGKSSDKAGTSTSTAAGKTSEKADTSPSTGASTSRMPSQKSDTFWTSCSYCTLKGVYYRIYLNKSLFCPGCGREFCAKERDAPDAEMEADYPRQLHPITRAQPMSSFWEKNPFDKTADETETEAQKMFATSKRERDEVWEAFRREKEAEAKKAKLDEDLKDK